MRTRSRVTQPNPEQEQLGRKRTCTFLGQWSLHNPSASWGSSENAKGLKSR
jgi:hypothetical protein